MRGGGGGEIGGGWRASLFLRARSGELRVKVEALLTSASKELMEAWSATNKSFSQRILETELAKKRSMENLEMTRHDLTDMEHHIKLLRKAVEEKRCPRMVAESRLEVRRTPCILVRGDQACNILPDMKHVKGWNRCLGLK